MTPIFFLLRLPFFLIGLALYASAGTAIMAVLWFLWAAWLLFKVPFQFVGKLFRAAFRNDSTILADWRHEAENWAECAGAVNDYFSGYQSLFRWLAHGSR
jgi:hypothetical protein